MDLSIIIVNYNNLDKIKVCLDSIYRSRFEQLSFEVIVVDNASGIDPEFALKDYGQLRLVKNKINVGMGAGNNAGARIAKGDYIMILNPDTEVESETIDKMLRYIEEHEDVGIVGPKLIYPDGERQISCYHFPTFLMPLYRRTFVGKIFSAELDHYLMKNYDLDKVINVDWLMGSCLLIKRDLYETLQGFDERFFMYYEDTDLCRRIKKMGKKVIYFPLATVIHHHSRASAKSHWFFSIFGNKMAQIHITSHLKYFKKWGL